MWQIACDCLLHILISELYQTLLSMVQVFFNVLVNLFTTFFILKLTCTVFCQLGQLQYAQYITRPIIQNRYSLRNLSNIYKRDFYNNRKRLKTVNYFDKKASSQMRNSVLNIHLEESTFPGSKYTKRSFLFDYIYGAAKEIEKNGVENKFLWRKKLKYGFRIPLAYLLLLFTLFVIANQLWKQILTLDLDCLNKLMVFYEKVNLLILLSSETKWRVDFQ